MIYSTNYVKALVDRVPIMHASLCSDIGGGRENGTPSDFAATP